MYLLSLLYTCSSHNISLLMHNETSKQKKLVSFTEMRYTHVMYMYLNKLYKIQMISIALTF